MNKRKPVRTQVTITAAEVGEYAYCAKAWQLKRAGIAPRGAQLEEGTAFHQQHGELTANAAHWERAGRLLAGLALLLLLGLVFYVLLVGGAP